MRLRRGGGFFALRLLDHRRGPGIVAVICGGGIFLRLRRGGGLFTLSLLGHGGGPGIVAVAAADVSLFGLCFLLLGHGGSPVVHGGLVGIRGGLRGVSAGFFGGGFVPGLLRRGIIRGRGRGFAALRSGAPGSGAAVCCGLPGVFRAGISSSLSACGLLICIRRAFSCLLLFRSCGILRSEIASDSGRNRVGEQLVIALVLGRVVLIVDHVRLDAAVALTALDLEEHEHH